MATLSQPMAALERANTIRLARADLRRKLSNRELTAGELLLDPPAAILTWEVGELLSAQWRWGDIRTRKFLGTMLAEQRIASYRVMGQRRVSAEDLRVFLDRNRDEQRR